MKKLVGLTVKEALSSGYRITDTKYACGYISRKVKVEDQPCYYAGGTRKGYIYAESPNFNSNRYFIRVYMIKDD